MISSNNNSKPTLIQALKAQGIVSSSIGAKNPVMQTLSATGDILLTLNGDHDIGYDYSSVTVLRTELSTHEYMKYKADFGRSLMPGAVEQINRDNNAVESYLSWYAINHLSQNDAIEMWRKFESVFPGTPVPSLLSFPIDDVTGLPIVGQVTEDADGHTRHVGTGAIIVRGDLRSLAKDAIGNKRPHSHDLVDDLPPWEPAALEWAAGLGIPLQDAAEWLTHNAVKLLRQILHSLLALRFPVPVPINPLVVTSDVSPDLNDTLRPTDNRSDNDDDYHRGD